MAILGKADYLKGTVGKSPDQGTDPSAAQKIIKDRARQIWEQLGKPQGQDLTIWLRAEKEILSSSR